ncbi:hypothetical protein JCM11641_004358 [Rhodosporidiobolus odoratus]
MPLRICTIPALLITLTDVSTPAHVAVDNFISQYATLADGIGELERGIEREVKVVAAQAEGARRLAVYCLYRAKKITGNSSAAARKTSESQAFDKMADHLLTSYRHLVFNASEATRIAVYLYDLGVLLEVDDIEDLDWGSTGTRLDLEPPAGETDSTLLWLFRQFLDELRPLGEKLKKGWSKSHIKRALAAVKLKYNDAAGSQDGAAEGAGDDAPAQDEDVSQGGAEEAAVEDDEMAGSAGEAAEAAGEVASQADAAEAAALQAADDGWPSGHGNVPLFRPDDDEADMGGMDDTGLFDDVSERMMAEQEQQTPAARQHSPANGLSPDPSSPLHGRQPRLAGASTSPSTSNQPLDPFSFLHPRIDSFPTEPHPLALSTASLAHRTLPGGQPTPQMYHEDYATFDPAERSAVGLHSRQDETRTFQALSPQAQADTLLLAQDIYVRSVSTLVHHKRSLEDENDRLHGQVKRLQRDLDQANTRARKADVATYDALLHLREVGQRLWPQQSAFDSEDEEEGEESEHDGDEDDGDDEDDGNDRDDGDDGAANDPTLQIHQELLSDCDSEDFDSTVSDKLKSYLDHYQRLIQVSRAIEGMIHYDRSETRYWRKKKALRRAEEREELAVMRAWRAEERAKKA